MVFLSENFHSYCMFWLNRNKCEKGRKPNLFGSWKYPRSTSLREDSLKYILLFFFLLKSFLPYNYVHINKSILVICSMPEFHTKVIIYPFHSVFRLRSIWPDPDPDPDLGPDPYQEAVIRIRSLKQNRGRLAYQLAKIKNTIFFKEITLFVQYPRITISISQEKSTDIIMNFKPYIDNKI